MQAFATAAAKAGCSQASTIANQANQATDRAIAKAQASSGQLCAGSFGNIVSSPAAEELCKQCSTVAVGESALEINLQPVTSDSAPWTQALVWSVWAPNWSAAATAGGGVVLVARTWSHVTSDSSAFCLLADRVHGLPEQWSGAELVRVGQHCTGKGRGGPFLQVSGTHAALAALAA